MASAFLIFETLCQTFQSNEPALARIAAMVHDLDLKDGRFGAPEAPAIGMVIEGLRLARSDDHAPLAEGMTLFETLYRALTKETLPTGFRRLRDAGAREAPVDAAARSRHAVGRSRSCAGAAAAFRIY